MKKALLIPADLWSCIYAESKAEIYRSPMSLIWRAQERLCEPSQTDSQRFYGPTEASKRLTTGIDKKT
jgi:hypothetical protein